MPQKVKKLTKLFENIAYIQPQLLLTATSTPSTEKGTLDIRSFAAFICSPWESLLPAKWEEKWRPERRSPVFLMFTIKKSYFVNLLRNEVDRNRQKLIHITYHSVTMDTIINWFLITFGAISATINNFVVFHPVSTNDKNKKNHSTLEISHMYSGH